jgi:putative membrane protein
MRTVIVSILLVLMTGLLVSGAALADGGEDDHMDGDDHMMGDWGSLYGGFWMLMMLLVFIAFGIWMYFMLTHDERGRRSAGPTNAQLLLDERYARGELETEEYLRMRDTVDRRR